MLKCALATRQSLRYFQQARFVQQARITFTTLNSCLPQTTYKQKNLQKKQAIKTFTALCLLKKPF